MQLARVVVQRFRNFVEPQEVAIEDDVTCLLGKNESGKTTLLKALYRLNPDDTSNEDSRFNVVTDYPSFLLSQDRRAGGIESAIPIEAHFNLTDDEREALAGELSRELPFGTYCVATCDYANERRALLVCSAKDVIQHALTMAQATDETSARLLESRDIDDALKRIDATIHENSTPGSRKKSPEHLLRSRLENLRWLTTSEFIPEVHSVLWPRLPQFFYFDDYQILPGECDLTELRNKPVASLQPRERTVLSLLDYAGVPLEAINDEDYQSRTSELQAASSTLTRQVFKYWTSNTDLEVHLDLDRPVHHTDQNRGEVRHAVLMVQLRDNRHGGVSTNFDTRSAGFQWFFSFLTAFSSHSESAYATIILLDEPGTRLHGEAQRDFVRYIYETLGKSNQTLYTTHSQHMVDPTKYEKIRAVEDQATRESPENGVKVTRLSLSASRSTLLPVEAALGYTISQHLFIGSGPHLAVEGSSDFIYLTKLSTLTESKGMNSLDPRFSIIPVGSLQNMPTFIALLGRRLQVTALVDGAKTNATHDRVVAAAEAVALTSDCIVRCDDVESVPKGGDIEDLFDLEDYLALYERTFGNRPNLDSHGGSGPPIIRRVEEAKGDKFDHARVAHVLQSDWDQIAPTLSPTTLKRFSDLFGRLNATLA